jgi:chemotaxis protein MotB
MARKKEQKAEAGAPMWVVTYGDMMSLLLCFFVMLVAMSEIKEEDKFKDVVQSMQEAFGFVGGMGRVPTLDPPTVSLLQKLENIVVPREVNKIGDSREEGVDGRKFRVTKIREGLQITVGGQLGFDRFSADLKLDAAALIPSYAEKIRGHTTKIEVRGHATSEPLPPDSPYNDAEDLSYARARAVAAVLVANGVNSRRIRLTACGSTEPLVNQAYTERRRAMNRRVEIIVTESVISDFDGREAEFKERQTNG